MIPTSDLDVGVKEQCYLSVPSSSNSDIKSSLLGKLEDNFRLELIMASISKIFKGTGSHMKNMLRL